MTENNVIFQKIAEALLIDYTSVYYIDAVTNAYQYYSIDSKFRSLQLEEGGDDFFKNLVRDADKVVYEEDKHIFFSDMQKEKLLSEMKSGTMQSITYRLMIDGQPVWHMLRLIRGGKSGGDYFVLGVINVDQSVRERQERAKLQREREIFNQLALGMAEHYDSLYYINMETDHYIECSFRDTYQKMHVPPEGDDFFTESKKNVDRFVHPDDLSQVEALWRKDVLLKNLENNTTCTFNYRLIIGGETMHCRRFDMWASDHKHVIMCVENINDEISREEELRRTQASNVTFSQIAERLAEHYDKIYYVDTVTESYVQFTSSDLQERLESPAEGSDFFECAKRDIDRMVYSDDRMMLHAFFNKALLLDGLQFPTVRHIEYRLLQNELPVYVRLLAMYTHDHRHLLFCVENIDEQVRALTSANELARTDKLTGTKNKNAYQENEKSLQANINVGAILSFALVVCDLNNLKRINDTLGHKAGDECIKAAGKLVCEVYAHSPVYRIGGDEFVVVLTGQDYKNRETLFEQLRERVLDNLRANVSPVIATGMSEYLSGVDAKVSDVFQRADNEMYEYKRKLKEGSVR